MIVCCDTCPFETTCEAEAEFDCNIGLHDWLTRGHKGDRWRECWLCGVVEEE